ncbi:alkaline phosphatase [Gloeothece citriformis PCC 7424]|uniref:Alkaline phosphatase n=1 Tax=Gloeothece citriformis (strain PCC 7424) TaxID=65393 RepID=B7KGD3_GLOC7|nr:alkaline phosphatase D family protein [Gloeothece citriformis]ACK70604.1 alkaline phosphatase [Gloeothece citriformis PCC 7424]
MTKMLNRRKFLSQSGLVGAGVIATNLLSKSSLSQVKAPAIITSDRERPKIPYGVASGDISQEGIVIWSKSERPSRIIVEYAVDESFRQAKKIVGSVVSSTTDYTGKIYLSNLPKDQDIFYRVFFQDIDNSKILSEPVIGYFRTPPKKGKDIFFAWSGDTAGQGWGINLDWGGMKIYQTISQLNPDFFIHCGDYIYADNPIESEVKLKNGEIWRNLTTEETSKVAETLTEFRGRYIYNLLDENVRNFNAKIPQIVQWDDHETTNNWYPTEQLLNDDRYTVKNVDLLASRAKQAFFEYTPIRHGKNEPKRIYRSINYSPSLDIFLVDLRSYRGVNSANRQPRLSEETNYFGGQQLRWLQQQLLASKATWKVISSDMPIGLIVRDGKSAFEAMANGDGEPLGRELEMVELLRFIKQNNLKNIVWLTADVHYAAVHYYNPNKAQFQDFNPFWEFVTGPLHAGSFGTNQLDNTFGIEVKFQSFPPEQNFPPTEGYQHFGTVNIDGVTEVMTVQQRNLLGDILYTVELQPEV